MEIKTRDEFVALMENLAASHTAGQFVALYGESDVKLNKKATDGSGDIKPADFCPRVKFHITFNFGQDYEKTMSRIMGEDYVASDHNRRHLVKNVLMEYVSTGTMCLIYMKDDYKYDGTFVNGHEITESEKAMIEKYTSKAQGSHSPVAYRTLNVKNIRKIVAKGEEYIIRI